MKEKQFIRSFSPQRLLCEYSFLIHNKRSLPEAFCFAHIKSSNQNLEASGQRCFAEISVCRKARSILEGI